MHNLAAPSCPAITVAADCLSEIPVSEIALDALQVSRLSKSSVLTPRRSQSPSRSARNRTFHSGAGCVGKERFITHCREEVALSPENLRGAGNGNRTRFQETAFTARAHHVWRASLGAIFRFRARSCSNEQLRCLRERTSAKLSPRKLVVQVCEFVVA
jgi:hypothetical protein